VVSGRFEHLESGSDDQNKRSSDCCWFFSSDCICSVSGLSRYAYVSQRLAITSQQLAIGLESGEILIYSNSHPSTQNWRLDTTVLSRLVDQFMERFLVHMFRNRTAHVDHIHRIAWQGTASPSQSMLASCSEDGTMRLLIVQSAME